MPKPRQYSSKEIRKIRINVLNCSQSIFASVLGVSIKTVQAWKPGERRPTLAALRLLELIELQMALPAKNLLQSQNGDLIRDY